MMRIGVLGGGQLGRMLALAGYPLGLEFHFYDPAPDCCAKDLGKITNASYQNTTQLHAFSQQVDCITFEHENVPADTVRFMQQFHELSPCAEALLVSQDRLLEKQLFTELNIPTAKYLAVNNHAQLENAAVTLQFPFILKTCRGGYDGKGQHRINDANDLKQILAQPITVPHIAEQVVPFTREVSMIGVRNKRGGCVFYDICENTHRSGILMHTINKPNDPLYQAAVKYTQKILQKFSYVGTIAVEFFQVGQQLIANEIAPRVHNTGHWTIEGAVTSQFENHLRAILDWPLGDTGSIGHATMTNLIGEIPNKFELLKTPGLHLHDYGKQAKPGRKIGHTTLVKAFSNL